ncbi:MAG: C39 family peptidase [Clostridiales bacterium]|jgi:uncharacterized protein YvpB|nr:C39 family peptidase [Clostridiales bacterium]
MMKNRPNKNPLILLACMASLSCVMMLNASAAPTALGYAIYARGAYWKTAKTLDVAIGAASAKDHSAVRLNTTPIVKPEWIFDNYPPFDVFVMGDESAMPNFSEYDSFAEAYAQAKKTPDSFIYHWSTGRLVWDNGTAIAGGETTDAAQPTPPIIPAPLILQMPELARGCEVTSLAMLINYLGVSATKQELADKIQKTDARDDPNKGFVGNMFTFDEMGYGVYHAPIYDLLSQYAPTAVDLSGCDFEVIDYYLDLGIPVWVIVNSKYAPLPDEEFDTWQLQDGDIKITYREHSVLVTGYDADNIYFNDPLGERAKTDYGDFEAAWVQMGKQAVTVMP